MVGLVWFGGWVGGGLLKSSVKTCESDFPFRLGLVGGGWCARVAFAITNKSPLNQNDFLACRSVYGFGFKVYMVVGEVYMDLALKCICKIGANMHFGFFTLPSGHAVLMPPQAV